MGGKFGPDILHRAAAYGAPRRTVILSVNDSVDVFVIPDWLAGRHCTFLMDGTDADIRFGASTVSVAYGATNTVTDGVITEGTTQGGHLRDAIPRPWIMPTAKEATHFAVDTLGSGTGKLYIELA